MQRRPARRTSAQKYVDVIEEKAGPRHKIHHVPFLGREIVLTPESRDQLASEGQRLASGHRV
jgi:hypothetical protein